MSVRSQGLSVSLYEHRHRAAIARLQRRLWSTDVALNERFFDWRYGAGAPSRPSLVFLVLDGDEPVAMRALHDSRWCAGPDGIEMSIYLVDDLVVASEFEGRGLFTLLDRAVRGELETRGIDFFLGLSAMRATQHLSLKHGALAVGPAKPLGRLPTAVRALDALRSAAARLPWVWRLAAGTLGRERASGFFARLDAAMPARDPASGVQVSVARALPAAAIAEFAAKLPHDGRIRRLRDAAYIAWRFRNPLHEYRCIVAERDGRLAGFLIVERPLSDLANRRRAHIVDWEVDTPAVREVLLRFALEAGRPSELVTWAGSAPADGRIALSACGFRPIDAEQTARGLPSILVWPVVQPPDRGRLRLGTRSLLDSANWDLRLADTSFV
ncbi:MAG: hypothetical protein CMLOHMNK_01394 [Steroidobacteraceae bacterium]|nr:hypothetical protein [Steroidobacteraceae bacterium]